MVSQIISVRYLHQKLSPLIDLPLEIMAQAFYQHQFIQLEEVLRLYGQMDRQCDSYISPRTQQKIVLIVCWEGRDARNKV